MKEVKVENSQVEQGILFNYNYRFLKQMDVLALSVVKSELCTRRDVCVQ